MFGSDGFCFHKWEDCLILEEAWDGAMEVLQVCRVCKAQRFVLQNCFCPQDNLAKSLNNIVLSECGKAVFLGKQNITSEKIKTGEKTMENETVGSWLDEESKNISMNSFGDVLPTLTLEEGKVVELVVDVSKPFGQWMDPDSKVVKKIIPVEVDGQKKNFWINTKNPVYKEIVLQCKSGNNRIKILRTGTMKNTRYSIVRN